MRRYGVLLRFILVFCVAPVLPVLKAQNYGQELTKDWQSILGISKQDGPYQWFGYPVDNFGVITTYQPPAGRTLTDADRLCATWSCVGIDSIPTDVVSFTTVNGYADAGQGPAIHLTNNKQGKAAITLLLSNLFNAITVNGSLNLSRDVTVDLTVDGIYKRSVNVQKFQDYINAKPNSIIAQVWKGGQLTYIGADIVAHNIKITLSMNVNKSATLNAQLTNAVGKLGNGSSAGVTLASMGNGQYIVQYPGFVILATQLHHQWKPGLLYSSSQGVAEEAKQFLAATSSVPKPQVDPQTLKVTKRQ